MHLPSSIGSIGLCLLAGWSGSKTPDPLRTDSTRTGRASFYHARSGQGTCTLPATPPWDSFYVALNRRDFAKSLACGACVRVYHDSDSVLVRVVDRCGGCGKGKIDLSRAAFRKLATLGTGHIGVRWRFAPCPDSSYAVRRTLGSSGFWSSLQAWGMPWPVESLSVAAADGSWQSFRRERHNHFTARKPPPLPWTLRSVDLFGRTRVDSLLDLNPGDTLLLDEYEDDSVRIDPSSTTPTVGSRP